jgi:hypothetical protein
MFKRWMGNLGAVLALIVVGALALMVLLQAATFYQVFLVKALLVDRWSITFWLDVFYMLSGLLWLGFFLVMEHLLLGQEAREGLLLPRALFAVGIELLLIGLLQAGLQAYQTFSWLGIGLTVLEVLVGCGLIWFARRKPRLPKTH